jgi:hypothetical protein
MLELEDTMKAENDAKEGSATQAALGIITMDGAERDRRLAQSALSLTKLQKYTDTAIAVNAELMCHRALAIGDSHHTDVARFTSEMNLVASKHEQLVVRLQRRLQEFASLHRLTLDLTDEGDKVDDASRPAVIDPGLGKTSVKEERGVGDMKPPSSKVKKAKVEAGDEKAECTGHYKRVHNYRIVMDGGRTIEYEVSQAHAAGREWRQALTLLGPGWTHAIKMFWRSSERGLYREMMQGPPTMECEEHTTPSPWTRRICHMKFAMGDRKVMFDILAPHSGKEVGEVNWEPASSLSSEWDDAIREFHRRVAALVAWQVRAEDLADQDSDWRPTPGSGVSHEYL